jgi:hypothetical protein
VVCSDATKDVIHRQLDLVSLEGTDDEYWSTFEAKGKELGVDMCHLPLPEFNPVKVFSKHNSLTADDIGPAICSAWYGNIARRLALAALQQKCREGANLKLFQAVRRYLFNIRHD